jgi:hypothetical protein
MLFIVMLLWLSPLILIGLFFLWLQEKIREG